MAYTVLARKYRSRSFNDVIGQEPIATTLVNAIKAERIHHGYLFTGTRGVGKTSMARILAKALNCLSTDEPTPEPCCECDACKAIAEGNDIDVAEIDAASNTGVDNIRELRSNTAYRPARARFKIYIIDEVHMLSTGAFNALLKTLEEPPEHVKFILATTEIQKVPATVRSRCQCFNFRNIDAETIAGRLASIAEEEGAKSDETVVRRVARLANGSMRDALSILDQLLSVSPSELSPAVLDEILPPSQNEQIFGLMSHFADADPAAALTCVERILGGGRGLDVFCHDCIEVARSLMLLRACGADSSIVDFPAGNRDECVALAARFELSHYVQMIAMFEELRRNVRFSSAGRALSDALIVRLANLRAWSSIEDLLASLSDATAGDAAPREKKKALAPSDQSRARKEAVSEPTRAHKKSPSDQSRAREEAVSEPTRARGGAPHSNEAGDAQAPEVMRVPVSSTDEARVRADPLVQRVFELFDARIVNIQREIVPAGDAASDNDPE